MTGNLREGQYNFFIISLSLLLRTQVYQTEVVQKIKTKDFNFFPLENRAVYETMSKKLYSRTGHRRPHGACVSRAG